MSRSLRAAYKRLRLTGTRTTETCARWPLRRVATSADCPSCSTGSASSLSIDRLVGLPSTPTACPMRPTTLPNGLGGPMARRWSGSSNSPHEDHGLTPRSEGTRTRSTTSKIQCLGARSARCTSMCSSRSAWAGGVRPSVGGSPKIAPRSLPSSMSKIAVRLTVIPRRCAVARQASIQARQRSAEDAFAATSISTGSTHDRLLSSSAPPARSPCMAASFSLNSSSSR